MSKIKLCEDFNNKERILITLNALEHNRGSEALVRGLVAAIKKEKQEVEIVVCSGETKAKVTIDGVDYMYPRLQRGKKYSPLFMLQVFFEKVLGKQISFFYRTLIAESKKADYIYVIGADNYDSLYGIRKKIEQINDMLFKESNAEIYLVDCSLEEKDITKDIIEDIKRFKIVTVRETISYEALRKNIPNINIKLIPDPAFIMGKQNVKELELLDNGDYVGINISDVILNAEKKETERLLNNYINVIEYIINVLQMRVVLFPHVMGNRDLKALKTLYHFFEQDDRVVLIEQESYNAEAIKGIIAKFRFIITARTHASIAAYSMCIPTLVVGYSVKSLGIAKDIFGREDNYVVSVSKLKSDKDMVEYFKWVYENEKRIKEHLSEFMPAYKEKVLEYGKL